MPGAVRSNDSCSGHGCWSARPPNTFSFNVLINGLGAVRMSDVWTLHCCWFICHTGTSTSASMTVMVNGLGAVRVGDSIDCGSTAVNGSMDVIIG
jgi:uncharacterized Zn-binding protein involved in type VI secretion